MGLPGFFERGLETLDQVVRQIADEPDRVAQQHRPPAGQLPAARAGVERGEQRVLHEHVGAGQHVHQRALAGVRVADQRDGHQVAPGGDFALLAALDGVQLPAQVLDLVFDQPAVFLQLGFARPAQADAFLLPRKVRPHPLQPRHRVFQLGQFDRQPGLGGLGAAGEDVEDQLRAIEHLQADGFLQVARLAGAEIVVEDHQIGVVGGGQRC